MATTPCISCYEDVHESSSGLLHPFQCQHSICGNCLQGLIKVKLSEMEPLTCPMPTCCKPARLNDLSYLHARLKFNAVRKKASLSPEWIPCKRPDCEGGRLKPIASSRTRYTCELCNYNQCWKCKEDHNQFISCEEYRELKDQDDPLYLSKKNNLIKDCPRCKIPISKAEGCLHMTCPQCKHEFNWETLKPWKGSDWYRLQNGNSIDRTEDTGREQSRAIR
ncbi:MAG: IBR domain-containing protein [Oligoflexales bacterium]|nr:IBR domain-containing protein [Oligoflexales bacterium]